MKALLYVYMLLVFIGCSQSNPKIMKETLSSNGVITVEAEGWAAILQQDIALAKNRALREAMYNAVKKAMGVIVEGQAIANGGVLVSKEIKEKSTGFVKKYDILNEYKKEGMYIVKIKAEVSKGKLTFSIKDLLDKLGKPKIAVLIDENLLGRKIPAWKSITATEITKYLISKGYDVVDLNTLKDFVGNNYALYLRNIKLAVQQLRQTGVEVILLGTAKVKDAGLIMQGLKSHSYQADIDLKIVNVGNNKVIFSDNVHGAYPHISKQTGPIRAIQRASKKLSAQIDMKLRKYWLDIIRNGRMIHLTVKGIAANKVNLFYDNIKDFIGGVLGVYHRSFNNNILYADVRFRGTIQDFIAELKSKNIGFNIKVNIFSSDSIYLTVF